jgi:nitrogen fixation NifU-like protein
MWRRHWTVCQKNKLHCSNLGADALQAALQDYADRKAGKPRPEREPTEKHTHSNGDGCYCPYCDAEVEEGVEFCEACHTKIEDHRMAE